MTTSELPKTIHGWSVVLESTAKNHLKLRLRKANRHDVTEEGEQSVSPLILFERAVPRALEQDVAESSPDDLQLWETRLNTAQIERDVARAARIAGEQARADAERKYGG